MPTLGRLTFWAGVGVAVGGVLALLLIWWLGLSLISLGVLIVLMELRNRRKARKANEASTGTATLVKRRAAARRITW